MIEAITRKLKSAKEAKEKKLQELLDQKVESAHALSGGLNAYLLENKDQLKEFLVEAGKTASVNIGARFALNPTAEPALKIVKKIDRDGSEAIILTVDAPDGHSQKEDLCIRVHRHITAAYNFDDSHYSHYYKPTENGIEPWAYPNGYCSDRNFEEDLVNLDFTPTPEKVIKDLEHQAKKIARKF